MPLRIDQAIVGDPLERGHIDASAEGRPGGTTGVIEKNDEDIWRARRRFVCEKCRPVRFGVADIKIYGSFEFSAHGIWRFRWLLSQDRLFFFAGPHDFNRAALFDLAMSKTLLRSTN